MSLCFCFVGGLARCGCLACFDRLQREGLKKSENGLFIINPA